MSGHPQTTSFPKDIFRQGIVWPDEVLIWGTGPNGNKYIPHMGNRFIIALNKAMWYAKEMTIIPEIWLVATPYYQRFEKDWWDEATKYARKIGTKIVFNWQLAAQVPYVDHTFYQSPHEFTDALDLGVVMSGGTIGGHAIQMALQMCNDPQIILNGVDMFGHTYACGSYSRHKPNEAWGELAQLQAIVNYAREHAQILSWSDSALDLEIKPPEKPKRTRFVKPY